PREVDGLAAQRHEHPRGVRALEVIGEAQEVAVGRRIVEADVARVPALLPELELHPHPAGWPRRSQGPTTPRRARVASAEPQGLTRAARLPNRRTCLPPPT